MDSIKNSLETVIMTSEEVAMFRGRLSECGALLGKRVVCIKAENIDLLYNEKSLKGIARLNYPVKKLFTEEIDIVKLSPVRASDGDLYMILNDRPELRFPIKSGKPDFIKSQIQDIHDAIRAYIDSKGEKVSFFSDVKLVNEVVIEENKKNSDMLKKLSEEFINQAMMLESISKNELERTDSYYKSLAD